MGPTIAIHKRRITFGHWTRYVILAISVICLTLLTSNCLILNFTIICMSDDDSLTNSTASGRLLENGLRYHYSSTQKGLLFSAVALGTLLGTVAVVRLSTFISIRKLFTAFGVISGISTIFLPQLASFGFYWLFIARICAGSRLSSYRLDYVTMVDFSRQWNVSLPIVLSFSGATLILLRISECEKNNRRQLSRHNFQLGPMLTMPLSGALCVSSLGWAYAYYFIGTLTLLAFLLFYIIFRDSPRFHTIVSEKELKIIERGKNVITKRQQKVPYGSLLKSIRIWAIWTLCTGGTFGFQLFFQYAPIYLNKVLHFEVESTGFATAMPYVFSMIIKVCTGPLSDHAPCMSEKARVMMFTFISQGTMAACFLCLAVIPPEMSTLGQVAYTAAIAFSGMNWAGGIRCAQLVARQHVHFVLAVLSVISCTIILILPAVVSTLAPNNTHKEWSLIFYIVFGMIVASNTFFALAADTKPAKWTGAKTSTVYSVPTTLDDMGSFKKERYPAHEEAPA
uniref:MFS domain-containing protein n=1 Tax=Ascaris lumbricoides TaxID=6252 RepID=A0A0M3HVI1_ASCLU